MRCLQNNNGGVMFNILQIPLFNERKKTFLMKTPNYCELLTEVGKTIVFDYFITTPLLAV
jgi:hypothetical protein